MRLLRLRLLLRLHLLRIPSLPHLRSQPLRLAPQIGIERAPADQAGAHDVLERVDPGVEIGPWHDFAKPGKPLVGMQAHDDGVEVTGDGFLVVLTTGVPSIRFGKSIAADKCFEVSDMHVFRFCWVIRTSESHQGLSE